MLNVKACRMERCRRGRSSPKAPIHSSQLAPSHTGSLEDLAIQEHPLKTVGHTDPPHNVRPSPVKTLLYHIDAFV